MEGTYCVASLIRNPAFFGGSRFVVGGQRKVLTAQLRELEADGVISRLTSNDIPPRVDYMLTGAGNELISVMEAMCSWGTKHLGVPRNLPRAKSV